METVAQTSTTAKAFYASLHGLPGILVRPNAPVLFVEPESGAVVTLSEADAPHLVVLGEVATSMAQYLSDMAAGGYAAVACRRRQEVA